MGCFVQVVVDKKKYNRNRIENRNLNPLSTYLAHWGYSFDGWGHQTSRPHKCIHLKVEGREKTCKKRKYEKVFSVYAHTNNVVQSKTRLFERIGLLQSWQRLSVVGVTKVPIL